MTTKTINTNELTDAQLLALVKARGLERVATSGDVIKLTSSGLYLKLSDWTATSKKGSKYTFGLNIPQEGIGAFVASVVDGRLAKLLKSLDNQ